MLIGFFRVQSEIVGGSTWRQSSLRQIYDEEVARRLY